MKFLTDKLGRQLLEREVRDYEDLQKRLKYRSRKYGARIRSRDAVKRKIK